MATLLLILIYLAFISLGLPDSILGVGWPVMQSDLNVSLEHGGYISLIVTIGTILSSLSSGCLISKLKTGKVIVLSIFLTSFALFGYSISNSYIFIMMFALPLGFGAGAIDTALNNYVALHYKPHHMNWLHSFWGIGASIGPAIMAFYLLDDRWRSGFLTIAAIQFVLMLIITLSLSLWKKQEEVNETPENKTPTSIWEIKGVVYALLIFLVYCAIEFSIGVWGSTYLVHSRNFMVSDAAIVITLYYLGITFGRFISGALTFFISNRKLIYGGIGLVLIGALLLVSSNNNTLILISFPLLGLGLAPIFPSMIHDTPKNFGTENSSYVIGYQIAFAYIGSAFFTSIFGILYSKISTSLFPLTIIILAVILLLLMVFLVLRVRKEEIFKRS